MPSPQTGGSTMPVSLPVSGSVVIDDVGAAVALVLVAAEVEVALRLVSVVVAEVPVSPLATAAHSADTIPTQPSFSAVHLLHTRLPPHAPAGSCWFAQ
jgi:hypothetical protein